MENFAATISDVRERLLVEQLVTAQQKSVVKILSNGVTEDSVIESANHAAWFANTMRRRSLDPELPAIACKEKCHWCCNQFVRMTAPEVFRVTRHIRSELSDVDQQALITRLERLHSESWGLSTETRGKINRACAYIYRGSCVIYDARPLMCQRQTSYKISDCRKAIASGFPFGSILSERASHLTHSASIQGLSDGFAETLGRGPLEPLEMTSATLTALTEPDCFDRWLAGDTVFAHCAFPH